MSKVDWYASRTVTINGLRVNITLNLNPEPAQWSFFLNKGSAHPIHVDGVENPLIMTAPVDTAKRRQVHEWLRSFTTVMDLPHWTMYRDVLIQVIELQHEEDQLRKSHEENEEFFAKRRAEHPPQ